MCFRDTPARRSPGGSCSSYSTLSEDVEGMADKLNILKVDEVVNHLRSYLGEEREQLVADLRFLQDCIEEEARAGRPGSEPHGEPSISGQSAPPLL